MENIIDPFKNKNTINTNIIDPFTQSESEGLVEDLLKPLGKAAVRVPATVIGGLGSSMVGGVAGLGAAATQPIRNVLYGTKIDPLTAANTEFERWTKKAQYIQTPEEEKSLNYIMKVMRPVEMAGEGWAGLTELATTGDFQKATDVIEGKSAGTTPVSKALAPVAATIGQVSTLFGGPKVLNKAPIVKNIVRDIIYEKSGLKGTEGIIEAPKTQPSVKPISNPWLKDRLTEASLQETLRPKGAKLEGTYWDYLDQMEKAQRWSDRIRPPETELPSGHIERGIEIPPPKPNELSSFDQMKLKVLRNSDPALWSATDRLFMDRLGESPLEPLQGAAEKPELFVSEQYAGAKTPERIPEAYRPTGKTFKEPIEQPTPFQEIWEAGTETTKKPGFTIKDKRTFKNILEDINTAVGKKGAIGEWEKSPESLAAKERLKEDLVKFSEAAKREGKDVVQYLKDIGASDDVIVPFVRLESELKKVRQPESELTGIKMSKIAESDPYIKMVLGKDSVVHLNGDTTFYRGMKESDNERPMAFWADEKWIADKYAERSGGSVKTDKLAGDYIDLTNDAVIQRLRFEMQSQSIKDVLSPEEVKAARNILDNTDSLRLFETTKDTSANNAGWSAIRKYLEDMSDNIKGFCFLDQHTEMGGYHKTFVSFDKIHPGGQRLKAEPVAYKEAINNLENRKNVRIAKGELRFANSETLHGTDINNLEGILANGLKAGSAIGGKDWAIESPVVVSVPTAKKGEYIAHNNYYKIKENAPVDKVTVDLDQYSDAVSEKVIAQVAELAKKYPKVKFTVLNVPEAIKPKYTLKDMMDIDNEIVELYKAPNPELDALKTEKAKILEPFKRGEYSYNTTGMSRELRGRLDEINAEIKLLERQRQNRINVLEEKARQAAIDVDRVEGTNFSEEVGTKSTKATSVVDRSSYVPRQDARSVTKDVTEPFKDKSKVITAWHVTNAKPFTEFKDGIAIPSSEGMYFWPTLEQARNMAGPNNRIIQVEIDLGRSTRLPEYAVGNFLRGTMSGKYDTAVGTGLFGDEIVVFNPKNVRITPRSEEIRIGDASKIDTTAKEKVDTGAKKSFLEYAKERGFEVEDLQKDEETYYKLKEAYIRETEGLDAEARMIAIHKELKSRHEAERLADEAFNPTDPEVVKYVKDRYRAVYDNPIYDNLQEFQKKDVRQHFRFLSQPKSVKSPRQKLEDKLDLLEEKIDKANNADSPNDVLIEKLEKQRDKIEQELERLGDETSTTLYSDPFGAHAAFKASKKILLEVSEDTGVKKYVQDSTEIADDFLGTISTRLANINPKLKYALRRFEFGRETKIVKYEKAVLPLLKATKKMSKVDQKSFDMARKNGNTIEVNALAEKYKIQNELATVRQVLDELYSEARKVGFNIKKYPEYHPREVIDFTGLMEYLYKTEDWTTIDTAIKAKEQKLQRYLTDQEKAKIVNSMLRGYATEQIALSKPGQLKARVISEITPEIDKFYGDSNSALLRYITDVTDIIEARKLFGKTAKKYEGFDADNSIGAYVLDLKNKGELSPAQERELTKILKARFHEVGTHGIVGLYKNLSYIDVMGSVMSTIVQIGDSAFSIHKYGVGKTVKGLGQTVSGKSVMSREDIGISRRIASEFSDKSRAAKAVDTVFKAIGLTGIDSVFKCTAINAAYDTAVKLARNPKTEAAFRKKLEPIFEKETDAVLEEFKNREVTENTKLYVFNEIADIQPIALSEMPVKYLTGGNGRIFYMLKTYTTKMLDVYRNEVYNKIKTSGQRLEGIKNLISLTAALVVMNTGADVLKDLLFGRPIDLEDHVVDNIWRTVGASRYTAEQAKRDGIGTAALKQILPPAKAIDAAYKDIRSMGDGKGSELIQSIPVFGKFYYWWFGKGADYSSKKAVKLAKDKYYKMAVEDIAKTGDINQKTIEIIQKDTRLSDKDLDNLWYRVKIGNDHAYKVSRMPFDKALREFSKASIEEKKILSEILANKYDRLSNEEKEKFDPEINKILAEEESKPVIDIKKFIFGKEDKQ